MVLFSSARLAAAILPIVLLVASAANADEQAGVLWETTSEAMMEGMPMKMPAQTTKVCAAKEWTRPLASADRNCTNSNFTKTGSKATWTVQCTGEMPMTGAGEITFSGTDSYAGAIKLASAQMNMTVKLSGRKIGGCDDPQ